MEHANKALSAPFFLSLHTPLPQSLKDAAISLLDSPPNSVLSFWNAQLGDIDTLVSASHSTEESCRALIPPLILPAAGRIQLASLNRLAI